ncbi:hypothetical protein [Clostridium botulinum]|uniref:Uncharacterized protein n=3 Tax=Clostridium botulinum TaxID=1491 RepID=C1FLF4_CLOBJ|nr:hypothetical protein [Clostridium botulinum]ACO86014.1 conserved hypothetical protein [Clostridium botulinum A2 str. Kyoto]APC78712.1 putative membrane protein [Clostridium botulinum]APC84612.1 putative membrane protein [Clostridium botulinum]APH22902.1 putative membrane protein [Clostridium botulinum]APQ70359.1 putative membrane protein [Clostridium botulinum]
MFLKIINFIDKYGTADYKGINLDFVIPNTQIYNFEQNLCYLETDENIIKDKDDIFIITEEEYIKYKQQHDKDIEESKKENIQPNQQQALNAKLLKDNANFQIELDKQEELNSSLLLKIAKSGGNANA